MLVFRIMASNYNIFVVSGFQVSKRGQQTQEVLGIFTTKEKAIQFGKKLIAEDFGCDSYWISHIQADTEYVMLYDTDCLEKIVL